MWRWTFIVLLYATAIAEDEDRGEWWKVNITQGLVVGRRESDAGLYAFYNIPYASASRDEDKFKAPRPPPKFRQPYYARDEGMICRQFNVGPLMPSGLLVTDRCLVTNVYVPDTEKKDLPVLVYIHGGAFQVSYGNWRYPKHLLKNKDVIVITFNYRLGIPGFLCLGTEEAPGNAGMKDQVALLRWVQENIAAFGGNPNDVTIAGYSAGSVSVDLLMLSKSAKGLFHKAIPESGASLGVSAIQMDPLQNAKDHARSLNFTNVDDIHALGKFYKSLSDEVLKSDAFMGRYDSTFLFAPCIERDNGDGTAFLTESPLEILKRGDYNKVPILYGFSNMEGLLRIDYFDTWKDKMNEKFSDFLPADLQFESEDEKEEVAEEIKQFYFGDKPIDNNSVLQYVDYFSDVFFCYSMLRAVKLHAEAGHDQLYLYEYSFVDKDTPVVPYTDVRGAPHIGQTYAVLDGKNLTCTNEDELSEEYIKMKKIMRDIWLNFVKTGKPVPEGSSLPEWPSAGADRSPHMSLGQKIELRGVLLEDRARFWDNIYDKYYREPIPPRELHSKSERSTAVTVSEASREEWLEVATAQGPVRAQKDSESNLYIFYGIPYATAPEGKDRFKAPLPPPTWTEPLDAIEEGIACPQDIMPIIPEMTVQKNCLIANVYVPDTKEKNLPVMVYVHGGAFHIGFGEMFKKKNLAKNKDVIIVSFNYRLGIYGFLCLGTEDAPGNAGMKDQVALLRWVQQNIAAFGGNPNDVTLAGYSAGSASVDLLMLSKSAEGLFHKLIPESGANLAVFAVQPDPLQVAKDYAIKMNFTNVDNIYDLEEFYKTLSPDFLPIQVYTDRPDSTLMFVPCVERDTGDGAFLTDSPLSILTRGDYKKVPVLHGVSNMEGLIRINFFETWKHKMNEKFSDFLPANLKFESKDEKEEVAKQVKQFYFGDKPVNNDNILQYVKYFSDVMFNYGTLRAVKLYVESGHEQVYLYEYSFVDEDTPVVPHTNVRGADHGAQTFAVSDGVNMLNTSEDEITKEYKILKKTIREMWLNFVKTGKPVPKGSHLPTWPAAGADRSPHMSIGQKVELRGVLLEERMRFWDNIYQKYYREPIPPPQPHARVRVEL